MIIDVEVGFRGTSVPFFVVSIYKSVLPIPSGKHAFCV
jgi:hypothetical protein